MALAEVRGGPESKSHVEVALVNEIIDQGRFEIIDRTSVQEALVSYPDRSDWKRLGGYLKADYILAFKVSEFAVKEKEGYDRVEEEDPSLEAETGNAKTSRYTKVKGRQGTVSLQGTVFNVVEGRVSYDGMGTAAEDMRVTEGNFSAPGKMQLLEKLTKRAIRDFFENMPRN